MLKKNDISNVDKVMGNGYLELGYRMSWQRIKAFIANSKTEAAAYDDQKEVISLDKVRILLSDNTALTVMDINRLITQAQDSDL